VAAELGLDCEFRQTNHEGVMVDWVQEAREKGAAVVINPAGLSFRSIPLLDALKTLDQPIAEVHVTNIHRRDPCTRHSLVSLAATGVICGFGPLATNGHPRRGPAQLPPCQPELDPFSHHHTTP
jgi:3-dehydroquinate dehydratase-2